MKRLILRALGVLVLPGTGVNQDDVFGGRSKKGDTCWLCDGKAKTMCGNCIDLTDPF